MSPSGAALDFACSHGRDFFLAKCRGILVQVAVNDQLMSSVAGEILNESEKANRGSCGSADAATAHRHAAFAARRKRCRRNHSFEFSEVFHVKNPGWEGALALLPLVDVLA